jgi:DNA-directed RNA polymerase specialized sigma24 family protein
VLILRWFVGLDVAETARVLGIAEGSVKSSTHRALKRLRVTGQLEETANGY